MRTRPIAALLGTLVAAATVVSGPTSVSAAGTLSFNVASPVLAGVGIDAQGTAYNPCGDQVGANSSFAKAVSTSQAKVRVELYPGGCSDSYDPWGNVGGIHFEVPRNGSGGYNAGNVRLPVAPNDGFKIHGDILSSTPVGKGRVRVDTFQVADFQQATVAYGGFASTTSLGNRWSGGVGWSGRYLFFIEDTQTNTKIQALHQVSPGSIPTIDLDAVCFGFDPCRYEKGGPPTTAGTFHPTPPTRILDTRRGLGITSGAVRTGDGRNSDPNPFVRLDEALNHELQVTGRYGVPATGVSAVLLNVTAVDAPGVGFLSVIPKPGRSGDIFNDQGSYGWYPDTSNVNVGSSDGVANLVLARVGAGGKIRLYNSFGPTNVIADIAGWYGTGGAHTNGSGFDGVVPSRVLDTRNGIGGPTKRFAAGESRSIQVRNVAGVPANAESVVVNITAVGPSRTGYATAFPDGTSLPDASNVNYVPGGVRANSAVVKIGANGRIRLQSSESDVDLIVDITGSFGPYGRGRVTSITPERLVDTRHGIGTPQVKFGQFETRTVQLAGRGTVPANATAIIANVTATNPTSLGFLTAWAGGTRPNASSLNFLAGQSVPNLVLIELGSGGRMSIFNELGTTDVIVDVMGYVT